MSKYDGNKNQMRQEFLEKRMNFIISNDIKKAFTKKYPWANRVKPDEFHFLPKDI